MARYFIETRQKKRLHKPCSDCGNSFLPTGSFCKYCEKCLSKRKRERKCTL